eukprot:214458-Chlamydomonas_euryale.AAC.2
MRCKATPRRCCVDSADTATHYHAYVRDVGRLVEDGAGMSSAVHVSWAASYMSSSLHSSCHGLPVMCHDCCMEHKLCDGAVSYVSRPLEHSSCHVLPDTCHGHRTAHGWHPSYELQHWICVRPPLKCHVMLPSCLTQNWDMRHARMHTEGTAMHGKALYAGRAMPSVTCPCWHAWLGMACDAQQPAPRLMP